MRRARLWSKGTAACVSALLVSACASAPRDVSLPVSDPNEAANRQVLAMNQQALGPLSEAVRATVPGPVHDRLHDLNSNLKEPRVLVNNVLQLRFDAAARTTTRFVLNTTLGIGGLFDVAGRQGIAQQSGDFGQTLFVWGVSEGPYVMQPYLGPATLRDAVDRLGQLKTAEDASIDFYSFVRSGYYQTRRAELREAIGLPSVVESPATADLDDPDDTGQAVAAAQ